MKKFEAQLEDFIKTSEKRMTAVMRDATQMVINDAQTPVAKGGKMRVDTGFLRASGKLGLNDIPVGASRGRNREEGEEGVIYETPENAATLKLNGAQIGDTIYFSWSASYARAREAYDGFLDSAVQQWPEFVAKVTRDIKARIK